MMRLVVVNQRSPLAAAASNSFRTAAFVVVRNHSSVSVEEAATTEHPELVKIPTLPLVGSMYPQWYSGIPPMDLNDWNGYWRKLHKEYGPFYSVGVPGIGAGIDGKLHVVRDPKEMLRVLKQEGSYPSGFVETDYPIIEYMKQKNYTSVGLFQRGQEWKRLRNFMQKDLLSPVSAKQYLPSIIKGAALASTKAADPESLSDIHRYLNLSAIDMFAHVLFGSGPEALGDDYLPFCSKVVDTLAGTLELLINPKQLAMYHMGMTSSLLKEFYVKWGEIDGIAERRLTEFVDAVQAKQASGEDLPEEITNCYLYKLLQRQPESDVTLKEALELCQLILVAAVDTTSTKTAFNLMQLSLNPLQQEQLYQELKAAVDRHGGSLTPEVFEEVPLLSAFVRETHRCTPALFADITKQVSVPTEVHGVTLPAGSMVQFDSLSNQMDPELVPEPMEFRPQRWLKEAVEARKNTPAAIIDHPFYTGPFSQGARRCPGSRVALLEVQAMIAQLLLDWKIEGPANTHWSEVPTKMRAMVVPVFPKELKFVPRGSA